MNSCLIFFESQHNLCIKDLDIELCIDNFRNLRNSCAKGGEKVQNDIIANPKLVEYCFDILRTLNSYSSCSELQIKCFQIGIQFIGNLIVCNSINKALIFIKYYQVLRNWLFNKDPLVRNNTEMVIYNILIDIQGVEDSILLDKKILEQIIDDALAEIEFGSLLLEKLIADNFSVLFSNTSNFYHLKLLKFTRKCLLNQDVIISNNSISFIKESAESLLPELFDNNHFEIQQTLLIIEMLKFLSRVTYISKYEHLLKSDESFILLILDKLSFIHKKGNEGKNIFTPHNGLDEIGSSELPYHPFYGVKSILIQIVGNLCYRNKMVQDKIRECNIIPIIVECCKFDAKNPFIMQWAIFTLANLSYNNEENKQALALTL